MLSGKPLGSSNWPVWISFGHPKSIQKRKCDSSRTTMFRNMFLHSLCSFCLHGLGGSGLGRLGNGFCLGFEGGGFVWVGGAWGSVARNACVPLKLQEQPNMHLTFAKMHKTLLGERLGCLGLDWVGLFLGCFWRLCFYWVGLAQGGLGLGWGDASRYPCSPTQLARCLIQ